MTVFGQPDALADALRDVVTIRARVREVEPGKWLATVNGPTSTIAGKGDTREAAVADLQGWLTRMQPS